MRVSRHRASHRAAATALVLGWAAAASGADRGASAQVAAAVADGVASEQVAYGDVNLAAPSGQRALLLRLGAAARRVCEPHAGRRLEQMKAYRNCVRDSLARAVHEVGNAEVTALFQSRTLSVGPS